MASEIELHSRAVHPNVIALYAAFEDLEGIHLVQELAPCGNLYQFVASEGGHLSEQQAAHLIIKPLLAVLQNLHSKVRLCDKNIS